VKPRKVPAETAVKTNLSLVKNPFFPVIAAIGFPAARRALSASIKK